MKEVLKYSQWSPIKLRHKFKRFNILLLQPLPVEAAKT